MNPAQFLTMLRRRWVAIAVCAVAGVALAAAANALTPTKYSATAEVFVSVEYYAGTQPPGINSTSEFALAQIQSYVRLATTSEVISTASRRLGRPIPKGEISATNPPTTVFVDVTSTSSSAGRAAGQANAVAASLVPYLAKVGTRLPDGSNAVKATIVEPAAVPASPSSPKTARNLLIGLLLGLATGLGLALVRQQYDDGGRRG